jgi:hypothetical protein
MATNSSCPSPSRRRRATTRTRTGRPTRAHLESAAHRATARGPSSSAEPSTSTSRPAPSAAAACACSPSSPSQRTSLASSDTSASPPSPRLELRHGSALLAEPRAATTSLRAIRADGTVRGALSDHEGAQSREPKHHAALLCARRSESAPPCPPSRPLVSHESGRREGGRAEPGRPIPPRRRSSTPKGSVVAGLGAPVAYAIPASDARRRNRCARLSGRPPRGPPLSSRSRSTNQTTAPSVASGTLLAPRVGL